MASLRDIRRRIRSVKNTQQITRAMKMVAAAKLRRSTEKVMAARPYAKSLGGLLAGLASRTGEGASPLLGQVEDEKRILVAVVTGDKGLCGAFNSNILRAAGHFIAEKEEALHRGISLRVEQGLHHAAPIHPREVNPRLATHLGEVATEHDLAIRL